MKRLLPILIVILLVFSGCTAAQTDNEPAAEPITATIEEPVSEPTEAPMEAPTPVPTEEPTQEPILTPLPAEPQTMLIQSADGTQLEATYYPAAVNPAPIVVLIHQVNFDQTQWKTIAPWLQNRGQLPVAKLNGNFLASPAKMDDGPWFDASWFPEIPEGLDLAVLTVTLRDCKGGCGDFLGQEWVEDSTAAITYASQLEGVDSTKILAVGTSIGADGVIDGCHAFFENTGQSCLAVLASSPGSYLKVPFDETALSLTKNGTLVLCYSGEDDGPSYATCTSVDETTSGYSTHFVPGNFHGIYGVDPQVEIPWINPMLDLFTEALP